jgi:poly(hydroxyalkanoate) depolymerase family esterase
MRRAAYGSVPNPRDGTVILQCNTTTRHRGDMAKLAPTVKLLRSMTRAVRSQQKTFAKVLDAYAPAPPPKTRKPARRPPAAPAPPRNLPFATGKWLTGQYLGDGLQVIHYWLYLPQRVPDTVARQGWPLVVMLHGCHQSATQFAEGTRMNRLAEDKGYAVLYPQQSASAQGQRCWRWYDRAAQQGEGETLALAGLVGAVCAGNPIDRRRVYACGLSAGAGMAALLALHHHDLIAAVALHSGPAVGAGHGPLGALHVMRHGAMHAQTAIPDLLAGGAMPAMPALLIQGEDDPVVRPVNQEQLAHQWLQLNGLPDGPPSRVAVKPAARNGSRHAHRIADYLVGRKILLRVVRIAGLGHAWSGGDPAYVFNAKAGPDASRMVLDFFGRHRR